MSEGKTWKIKTVDGEEDMFVEADFEMVRQDNEIVFKNRTGEAVITFPLSGIVRISEMAATENVGILA